MNFSKDAFKNCKYKMKILSLMSSIKKGKAKWVEISTSLSKKVDKITFLARS